MLTFRGGKANAETITYVVGAYQDGVTLFAMHVRLNGVRENLSGTDMCWRTFSIVNGN